MNATAEIVDFFQPLENEKNLYISQIFFRSDEEIGEESRLISSQTCLHEVCSRYGLVYETQVFSSGFNKQLQLPSNAPSELATGGDEELEAYYAFVKFYSAAAAKKAQHCLNQTHFLGEKPCKVNFAKRKHANKEKKELYASQCTLLANYYLGFNGWTSRIRLLKEQEVTNDFPVAGKETKKCCFFCVIELEMKGQGLCSQGFSSVQDSFSPADPKSKLDCFKRCRKRAQEHALRHAFSKVILVETGRGRVYPEIDNTRVDPASTLEWRCDEDVLKVAELEEEPQESTDEDEEMKGKSRREVHLSSEDQANVEILQALADEGS